MLLTLLAGIITGFIVSVPPIGPVAFALISKGFKNEFKEGIVMAAGSGFMDFIYALIAFGGVSLFISLLPDSLQEFYHENVNIIQILLIYMGCVIVIVYGIKLLRSKLAYEKIQSSDIIVEEIKHKAEEVQKVVPVKDKASYFSLFIAGILMVISSITLPASWIAIVGYVKGLRIIESSFLGGLLFSVGAFIGTVLWFYVLLKLITANSHRINPLTVNKLNVGAGIILLILGMALFTKATLTIFSL